jgi:formate hydrogenlyase subunit 3/multisubunit Na+/H+ antiporter MnhD subunit
MNRLFSLLFAGGIVGMFVGMSVYFMVFFWEERRPLVSKTSPEQKHVFVGTMVRATICAWVIGTLLYIAVTYWWP